MKIFSLIFLFSLIAFASCKKDSSTPAPAGLLQLSSAKIGINYLDIQSNNTSMPIDKGIVIQFNTALDTAGIRSKFFIVTDNQTELAYNISFLDEFKTVVLTPVQPLVNSTHYTLQVALGLKGKAGEKFEGVIYQFTCIAGKMSIESVNINGTAVNSSTVAQNIDFHQAKVEFTFSQALDANHYETFFHLLNSAGLTASISPDHKKVSFINASALKPYTRYTFTASSQLTSANGFLFDGFSFSFFTCEDSTYKFPIISDDDLLTLVQKQTFNYFWDQAHPACGMARERNSSGDIVTTGGSGFGVMAMIVAMERGFISRADGLARVSKILNFLETCDRFHGAWPHWINGNTGKVVPFGAKDNGGDLVETSFMVQGLITMRQYMDAAVADEKTVIDRINVLIAGVEYDWYTHGQNVLFWNWSPTDAWAINVRLQGYNETLITYVLAASSGTHSISADAYHQGYTRNGAYKNGRTFFGYQLPLGEDYGGPLFFTHYSFLGLDPRNLQDANANYWTQNVNQSMINYEYCKANPRHYVGYSTNCWGLTASDNSTGYSAQSPTNDLGVITPTAALSSFPYTPVQSMAALKQFYYVLGDKLWGPSGFYDAFDVHSSWWADSYLAIDQGPIICMMENYRSGLLWKLFMSAPEVKTGLDKLGFTY